jgi:hypothetical protein
MCLACKCVQSRDRTDGHQPERRQRLDGRRDQEKRSSLMRRAVPLVFNVNRDPKLLQNSIGVLRCDYDWWKAGDGSN